MASNKPITVLYFASVRTLLGISSEAISLPKPSYPLSSLPDLLASRHAEHATELRSLLSTTKWSVEQTMVDAEDETLLEGGEEVAVIPPGTEEHPLNLKPLPSEKKVKTPPKVQGVYCAAPDGADSNLIIFLHGLGDTSKGFANLAKNLQRTLPQTATLTLQAEMRVPFLEEEAWMWWNAFDAFGELLTKPDPTRTVERMCEVLRHLVEDCGWPINAIHFFGFGQGASVALETAVAFARKRRAQKKDGDQFASVAAVCGGFVSHPTIDPPLKLPILYVHRSCNPSLAQASLRKATTALQVVKLDAVRTPDGEVDEAMPRNKEWDEIMRFWARVLRSKTTWEWDGSVHSVS